MAKKKKAPPTNDREVPEETQPSEEEQTLKDEGIDFFKIPLPKMDDKKKN